MQHFATVANVLASLSKQSWTAVAKQMSELGKHNIDT
jgi:hypothetical protein